MAGIIFEEKIGPLSINNIKVILRIVRAIPYDGIKFLLKLSRIFIDPKALLQCEFSIRFPFIPVLYPRKRLIKTFTIQLRYAEAPVLRGQPYFERVGFLIV